MGTTAEFGHDSSGGSLTAGHSGLDACPPKAGYRLSHTLSLDGLRGVACLMVIAHHFRLPVPGGFLGVDIFFVLSGFLITALLLQEWDRCGGINLKHFYLRRVLRLFPALALMFAVSMAFSAAFLPRADYRDVRTGAAVALIAQTNNMVFLGRTIFQPFSHTWSLSVEDKFYMFWPLAMCALLSQNNMTRRSKVWTVFGAVLVCAGLRARLFYVLPEAASTWYIDSLCRADSMLIGCLTAMLAVWNMLPSAKWFRTTTSTVGQIFLVALTYLLFQGYSLAGHLYYGTFTLIAVGTAAIIVKLIQSRTSGLSLVLEHPLLTWTGRLSYGLYLWHLPVLMYYMQFHHQVTGHKNFVPGVSSHWYLLGVIGTTYVIATLSYVLVEKPLLKLKPKNGNPDAQIRLADHSTETAEPVLQAA